MLAGFGSLRMEQCEAYALQKSLRQMEPIEKRIRRFLARPDTMKALAEARKNQAVLAWAGKLKMSDGIKSSAFSPVNFWPQREGASVSPPVKTLLRSAHRHALRPVSPAQQKTPCA